MRPAPYSFCVAESGGLYSPVILRSATGNEFTAVSAGRYPPIFLSVPHHGGNVADRRRRGESYVEYEARVQEDLTWLYSAGVRCRFAIVSVGTNNQYGHPNAKAISALRSSGAHVLCTQITPQCHDDLEQLRPGVRRAEYPSQSRGGRDLTTGGKSRNVACPERSSRRSGPMK